MIAYSNNIVFMVFAILFPILVLCSSKKVVGGPAGGPLSVNNTRCIKGVLAIWIMLLHFVQHTMLSGPYKILKVYDYTGFLAVAGFLFVAGYVFQKNIYRKSILLKQNIRVYFTWVFICVLFIVPLSNGFDIIALIKYILFMGLRIQSDGVINGCWFIIALIFLYTVHWLISKIQNKKVRLTLLFTAIVLYTLFWILLDAGIHWYSAVIAYYLGVITGEYETNISKILNSKLSLCMSFTGLVISLVLSIIIDNKVVILFYWLASTCFCALIFWIFEHIEIKSKLIGFVGTISLEFFLVHIRLLDCMIAHNEVMSGWCFAIMLLFCVVVSKIVYEFMKRLMNLLFSNS